MASQPQLQPHLQLQSQPVGAAVPPPGSARVCSVATVGLPLPVAAGTCGAQTTVAVEAATQLQGPTASPVLPHLAAVTTAMPATAPPLPPLTTVTLPLLTNRSTHAFQNSTIGSNPTTAGNNNNNYVKVQAGSLWSSSGSGVNLGGQATGLLGGVTATVGEGLTPGGYPGGGVGAPVRPLNTGSSSSSEAAGTVAMVATPTATVGMVAPMMSGAMMDQQQQQQALYSNSSGTKSPQSLLCLVLDE